MPLFCQIFYIGGPVMGCHNLSDMRTEFGQRLFEARTYAKLTQTKLCQIVGMSQGTYGELERSGSSSSYTPAIATVCRVDVNWLAYGEGEMALAPTKDRPPLARVSDRREPTHTIPSLEDACNTLARYFEGMPKEDMDNAVRWLSGLVYQPSSAPHVIGALMEMVATPRKSPPGTATGTRAQTD
jgi:transcriptional regulator with XRE-family HTH domain